MRQFLGTLLAVLAPISVFAQAPAAKLEFEVASVRPAPPAGTGQQVNIGVHVDGAMVNIRSLSMRDYLMVAYQLKNYQIVGPDWITAERYDVSGKLPEGATRAQVPAMLQALLAERFGLKAHRDTKDFPVYALTVAKGGPKMKESPLEPEPEGAPKGSVDVKVSGGRAGTRLSFGRGSFFNFADNKIEGTKLGMQSLADTLARFLDRPVIDATGLTPTYDFVLTFAPEDFIAMQVRAATAAGVILPPEAMRFLETAHGDSLFSALETIGLKLESRKAPLEVLVVDSVQQKPTEN